MFERDDSSVGCGVFYCCLDDGEVPQSVCVVAVSCEYLLTVFENLEFIFDEQGEAAVFEEFSN